MKKKDALKKIENQSVLLRILGRWIGRVIAERLNKGLKVNDIKYTTMLAQKGALRNLAHSGILILRGGLQSDHSIAIIDTSFSTVDAPFIRITPFARELLSEKEYQRFVKKMKQIAIEMRLYFTEK